MGIVMIVAILFTLMVWAFVLTLRLHDGTPKKTKQKAKTNIIEKHYTREDFLIEAHDLLKYYGRGWTFEKAKEKIEQRMALVEQTMGRSASGKNKKFDYKCPVCNERNYGLDFIGPQIYCKCPSSKKIKAIYEEQKWESPY